MINQELTYWVALAHTPTIWTSRKNEMVAHCVKQGESLIDFFESDDFLGMLLPPGEVSLLRQTKAVLGNYAFMTEELIDQGFDIIPITASEYSPQLKSDLKFKSPVILYTKGDKRLLKENAIAIVGSRNANDRSLIFTDNIAQKAVSEGKIVVIGFAKGVDKQALDTVLQYNGKSIIVLSQGITTFAGGMKKYHAQIIKGDVLVVSAFHPKSPWSEELAMARNPIIYGLASEIFVAQSDDKGGTWSDVVDGLKEGRAIYVRYPNDRERCANLALIEQGAIAVGIHGEPLFLRQ